MSNNISRRDFLKALGLGTAATAAATLPGCTPKNNPLTGNQTTGTLAEIPTDKMTYRTTPTTGDKVSILGFGCMRFPTIAGSSGRENKDDLDQEQINRMIDYALEHGVNYFDTSPAYCQGRSEKATGIALSRHPRNTYYIATKMSNFAPKTWPREESIKMYRNSLKELQTDYIDYMLLHAIGNSAVDKNGKNLNGMEAFKARYIDNGILDFLVQERAAGRIRNLGFSYHGDVEVFDYLLSQHDKYHWNFVQIQLNYIDWNHAKQINERNTNAEYLQGELDSRGIPSVIMEPLLGGRLAKVPDHIAQEMKKREPQKSIASWAFRYAGTHPGVLTVLSGMTYMEHLQDNLRSYCPLVPLTEEEQQFLYRMAGLYVEFPLIPCTDCKYCMPCPYGIDIPANFKHYNTCVNEGNIPEEAGNKQYRKARRAYLIGYDRSVPRLRQASHCIGCNTCVSHCPQNIDIPDQLHRIDRFVEKLKKGEPISKAASAAAAATVHAEQTPMARTIELLHQSHSLAIYNHGELRSFDGRGVSDLLHLVTEEPEALKGALVADKIIGKAAASLMICGGVAEVYTDIISEAAVAILEQYGIKYSYRERIDHIINREGTGWCPMELLCQDAPTAEECLSRLSSKLR